MCPYTQASPILRCPRSGVAVLPTNRPSFEPTLQYTSFAFFYATLPKRLAHFSTFRGSSKSAYIPAQHARLKGLPSRSVAYESFFPFRRSSSSDGFHNFMVSGWNSDFLLCNRHPHIQPTVSSSSMVGSHILYHSHRLMGCPRARHLRRKIRR